MLKRIPKSDISIRPFKAYKQWSFDNTNDDISILEADINSTDYSGEYPKNSIYGQLRAQFYNEHIDNPFLRFGVKSTEYSTGNSSERFLSGSAKVISIPQIYVGEGIKKGSVLLNDGGVHFEDNGYGSLISADGDTVTFIYYDNQNASASFNDYLGTNYNIIIDSLPYSLDIEDAKIYCRYNGEVYFANVISFNLETGEMLVDNFEFLEGAAGTDKIGNVFYNQGLIVLTRKVENLLNGNWNLSFKSTKTIYEHEYLLIVNPDEYNISQNPSAVKEVGFEYEFVTASDGKRYKVNTKTGARYIRKKMELENGQVLDFRYGSSVNSAISGGFEHWDVSGSVDSTGSFLTPFITTIGLYDDDGDMLAVAKLPRPIKSEPDFPVNFIVRFDI